MVVLQKKTIPVWAAKKNDDQEIKPRAPFLHMSGQWNVPSLRGLFAFPNVLREMLRGGARQAHRPRPNLVPVQLRSLFVNFFCILFIILQKMNNIIDRLIGSIRRRRGAKIRLPPPPFSGTVSQPKGPGHPEGNGGAGEQLPGEGLDLGHRRGQSKARASDPEGGNTEEKTRIGIHDHVQAIRETPDCPVTASPNFVTSTSHFATGISGSRNTRKWR